MEMGEKGGAVKAWEGFIVLASVKLNDSSGVSAFSPGYFWCQ